MTPAQVTRNLCAIRLFDLPATGISETAAGIRSGLHDPRPAVRQNCVAAAAWLGEDCDVLVLEEIASSSRDFDTVEAAITSIQSIGFTRGTMDTARVSRLRGPARALFDLKTDDWHRLRAATVMASLGDGSRYKVVLDRLQNSKEPYQAIVFSYLFARLVPTGDDGKTIDWVGILAKILTDQARPQMHRIDAAISLGELGTPEAERALRDALTGEKNRIVASLIKAQLNALRRERGELPPLIPPKSSPGTAAVGGIM